MEDINYGELFGIDETGAEVTDPAAPSEDTGTTQGEKEQDPAAPAGDHQEETEDGTGGEAGAGEHTEEDEGRKVQSQEERAKFAAARRKAEKERDAAVEKAKQDAAAEAQRTIDEAFRNSGLTNPYTKQPITTKAEYDAYKARFDEERKALLLKKSGMSDEEFRAFVQGLPEVQAAKQAQEAAQAAARQAQEQQAKLKVDEQLKEIAAIDPSIQSLQDLAKMETYPKFYELVKKGNTLTDAFKLANYDAIAKNAAAASRQAALNAANGKQHLSQTTQRGAGAITVPAEVAEEYRAFNPGITDEEIQKHYTKYTKK